MKALLLKGLLYVAKTIAADVIRRKFEKSGADKEGANIVSRVHAAKLENLFKLVK